MPGAAPQSNNLASRDGATSARSGMESEHVALVLEAQVTTGIFLTFTSDRVGIVRRRAAGANPGRNDGNGGNMSMLRYYTDDSPGLKITPVCLVHEALFAHALF